MKWYAIDVKNYSKQFNKMVKVLNEHNFKYEISQNGSYAHFEIFGNYDEISDLIMEV